jgi:hypothetical protein
MIYSVYSIILAIMIQTIFTTGNVVYLARVLLHGFEDKEYLNKCEIVEPPNNNERRANFDERENTLINKFESTTNYENSFSIFPNPNNGRFSLSCPNNSSFNFEIISSIGQIVKSGNIQNSKGYIDINCSDFIALKFILFQRYKSEAKNPPRRIDSD